VLRVVVFGLAAAALSVASTGGPIAASTTATHAATSTTTKARPYID
jgi:hypothetical protein